MKEVPSVALHSEAAEETVAVARNRRPTLLTRASRQTKPCVLIVLSGDDLEMHRFSKEKFGSIRYVHSTNHLPFEGLYLFHVTLKKSDQDTEEKLYFQLY